jgi:hypothetical protein
LVSWSFAEHLNAWTNNKGDDALLHALLQHLFQRQQQHGFSTIHKYILVTPQDAQNAPLAVRMLNSAALALLAQVSNTRGKLS